MVKQINARSGDFQVFIPKNSTDISSGDVVVMPKKSSPRSRAYLGTLNRISPISSKEHAPFMVGISDADHDTTTVGATLYAATTSDQAIPVYRRGVFDLAIVATAGNKGDLIKYSSGGTGAQLFTIDNAELGKAIGVIEKTFTGATANDRQLVRIIEKDLYGADLAWYFENRVINDCKIFPATHASKHSWIQVGLSSPGDRGQGNHFVIQGKLFSLARDSDIDINKLTGGAASLCKAHMMVARSNTFAFRTCSGTKTLTTFTKTGFSAAHFTPKTITSGEVCIGYVVFMSAEVIASAGMIFMVRGPVELPHYCHWAL